MLHKYFWLGVLCFLTPQLHAEICPETHYTLTTMEELNSFGQLGCTSVRGRLEVLPTPNSNFTNDEITNLSGLRHLRDVGGFMQISNNRALKNVDELINLQSVYTSISFFNNENLENIDGLVNLQSSYGLTLSNNTNLQNIDGIRNLRGLKSIYIGGSDQITDLRGLASVASVSQELTITYNASLDTLSGLENLTEVGQLLRINHNPSLADCRAIGSLPVLAEDNPATPEVVIGDNAEGCNSPDEILQAMASTPTDILRLGVETPVADEVYSGVSLIRGWAVANEGIDRVDIYFGDTFFQSAPYGGKRQDVANVFPDVEDAIESGFALAFNYSSLAIGAHSMRVEVVTKSGRVLERTVDFEVTKFHKNFIGKADNVDIDNASCVIAESKVQLIDALIDGEIYDISMRWRTADQDFQIMEIR